MTTPDALAKRRELVATLRRYFAWTASLGLLILVAFLGVNIALIAQSRNNVDEQRRNEKEKAVDQRNRAIDEQNKARRSQYDAELASGQGDWEDKNISG